MRKSILRLLTAGTALAAITMATASAQAEDKMPKRIGYVVNYATHEWYQNVIKGMMDRGAQLGIEVEVKTGSGPGGRFARCATQAGGTQVLHSDDEVALIQLEACFDELLLLVRITDLHDDGDYRLTGGSLVAEDDTATCDVLIEVVKVRPGRLDPALTSGTAKGRQERMTQAGSVP